MIQNIIRSLLTYLSFPQNLISEKVSLKQKKIMNEVLIMSRKNITFKEKKLKTHSIFSKKVLELIEKKKLNDFLKKPFIQKMFFVHNRFYIVILLIELFLSKNWILWKKLLKESNIGGPIPFFCYRNSSGNKIRQVYHLKKLSESTTVNLKKIKNIVEIGGGYGCMPLIFNNLNKSINYYIFDTKEVCLLQYYYLKSHNLSVSCGIQNKKISLISDISELKKINKIKNLKNNNTLILSNWAFSEIPISLRKKIEIIILDFELILMSFQSIFENIDNKIFFQKFSKKFKKSLITKFLKIKAMNFMNSNKHFYLFIYK